MASPFKILKRRRDAHLDDCDLMQLPGDPSTENQSTNGSSRSDSLESEGPGSGAVLYLPLGPSPRRPPPKPWRPPAGATAAPRSLEQVERRPSLNRTSWLGAGNLPRRRTDGDRDSTAELEPILLSSEEEDGEQEEGVQPTIAEPMQACGSASSGLGPGPGSRPGSRPGPGARVGQRGGTGAAAQAAPTVMELAFIDLHIGLTRTQPNGALMITEHSITLPLRGGPAEAGGECEVVVVASQVRGHGLWDRGASRGGPSHSLLFLWVTDAQAKLLQTELSHIHPVATPDGSCVFVLVVLSVCVSELQAALCLSLLDTKHYCSSSSMDLGQAVCLVSSLPAPLRTHLLLLLEQPASSLGQMLMQYPPPPSKGRIAVTTEDLACLHQGGFLNDVIIDFYLKYLLLEKVDAGFSDRCHIFSSFFFKQLSRRRAQGEDSPAPLNREMRHQRVKTWTRHVDIFTKDFLFVPVNQEAHWYLLVICFPGLEGIQHQEWAGPVAKPQCSGAADKSQTKPSAFTLRPPECSQAGCKRGRILKRPCILVMDSLKGSAHENTCRLLRDYLQVEWQARRGTSRPFTADTVLSTVCAVPLQDNSSDCGLYLLQYAESFLQNPVVHFDLPVRLDGWFPRQMIRSKRDQIRSLVLDLREDQKQPGPR